MSDLRGIIVNAVSEMLDDPGENGIYKTARLYDRLETEVQEHFATLPNAANIHTLMLETVKNSYFIHPEMQKVIAKYLDYQSSPKTMVKPLDVKL